MASVKGRQSLWKNRELQLFIVEKRIEKRAREQERRERAKQRVERIHATRREEAIRLILAQVGDLDAFGLAWEPTLSWARGSSIWPFARIFDDLVHPEWKVTVHHDILESGSPGWFFERIRRAA